MGVGLGLSASRGLGPFFDWIQSIISDKTAS